MSRIPNSLKLRVKWSKREKDFVVYYPRKGDGGWILDCILKPRTYFLLNSSGEREKNLVRVCEARELPGFSVFEEDFIKELESRGYDKASLKFEVSIKLDELFKQFSHLWDYLTPKERAQLESQGIKPPKKS